MLYRIKIVSLTCKNVSIDTGPDLGKKLDEAGISAAKRPGGAGGEAGGKFRWGEAPSR